MQKPVASQIPRGVGCPPPPGMDPRKGKGKLMCIKVRMLDDTVGVFHLGHKAIGQALFDEVCRHLNLLESDYFGLEFIDSYGNRCWLDKEKSILRQIVAAQSDARFFLVLKFYTPNPAELEEEYTRYLFALQIRRDLARGELMCNENTAALLASFIVQAECGDFSPVDYPNPGYLSGARFVPNQTPAFQMRVMDQHQKLVGMSPAEADFALLETARRCEYYGVRMHSARDIEGTEVALSVAHMGIKVFHLQSCVTTFSWAKVRKLSFKRKRLMIKVHPDSSQFYKETVEFGFEKRDDCKNFWKKCVEHHSFFRCTEPLSPRDASSSSGRRHLFARGSNFHYRGRTQQQLIDYVREHRKRREPFQRPIRRVQPQLPFGTTNSSQPHTRAQFLVSDRFATDPMMGNGRQNGQPHVCPMAALCHSGTNGNGAKRPKSAILGIGAGERRVADSATEKATSAMMQHSYHAGMCQQVQNGPVVDPSCVSPSCSSSAWLLHQHMDPMSLSLPNVTDVKTALPKQSAQQQMTTAFYQKSASGENFHRAQMGDNQSEGSYRPGAPSTDSSQSDLGYAQEVDPRVYQTTFTTKRLGDVIVKKVTAQREEDVGRRPRPLASRSAVDGEEGADSGGADSRSECSVAATAPPSTAGARNGGGTRIRCAPHQQALSGRLRNEIPVAIDGPPPTKMSPSPPTQTTAPSSTTIIRPVLIPAAPCSSAPLGQAVRSGKAHPMSSCSASSLSSCTSTPTQSSAALRRPLVIKAPDYSRIAPLEKEQQRAGGPVHGRVVRREDLVITPAGIGLKEAEKVRVQERPKVPPKPADLATFGVPLSVTQQETAADVGIDKLLDPLESILKDVRAVNEVLDDLESPTSRAALHTAAAISHRPPAAISIESEEQPEVRTVHLFNGEQIPYTLTVRDLTTQQQKRTANETGGQAQGEGPSTGKQRPGPTPAVVPAMGGRHKSIELVQRKRLPSQDSYSSQDHSISPTTPDTGNVLEYVMRQRSASSDRAAASVKAAIGGAGPKSNRRKATERRLTVEIGQTALKKAPEEGEEKQEGTAKEEENRQQSGLLETDF